MIRLSKIVAHLTFIMLCFLGSLGNATDSATTPDSSQAGSKAIWAWADKSGSEHAVFISRQVGNAWENPQKVSTNEGVNIVPVVATTSGENLMVVWSDYIGTQAQLHYRQLKDGQWSEEKEYYTGLSSNLAPSISIDRNGTLWLAWVGFSGISDEIYYTTWNGTSFGPAAAITSNNIPDIQPVLGIDATTGTPWVQWLQFSAKGYVKYESMWTGSDWGEPLQVSSATTSTSGGTSNTGLKAVVMKRASATGSKSATTENQASAETTADQLQITIPDFITIPQSASIHIPGYAIQSLPVRSVTIIK